MHFVDELVKEIKKKGLMEDMSRESGVAQKVRFLDEILININIFKERMSHLSLDEQLYLSYRISSCGVDMEICPHFYMFFSGKYKKFHHTCLKREKVRTHCKGKKQRCDAL
jgi:hypothetical protein